MSYRITSKCGYDLREFNELSDAVEEIAINSKKWDHEVEFIPSVAEEKKPDELVIREVLALTKGDCGGHYLIRHVERDNNDFLKVYYWKQDDTWTNPGALAFEYDLGNNTMLQWADKKQTEDGRIFDYELIIAYERKYRDRWVDNECVIVELS